MSDAGIIYSPSNFVHLTIIFQFFSILHYRFGSQRDLRHKHANSICIQLHRSDQKTPLIPTNSPNLKNDFSSISSKLIL